MSSRCIPSDLDEDAFPRDMLPAELARRLAVAKAETIADRQPNAAGLVRNTGRWPSATRFLGKP